MNNFSICIIGSGSASLISTLALLNAAKRENILVEITCIHDEKIPITQIGESTSSIILTLLTNVLGFRVLRDLPKLDGTLKYGTKYKNWSEKDFYTFHVDPAIHINSSKFSSWGIKELEKKFKQNYKVINDNVSKVKNIYNKVEVTGIKNQYYFDYVIDCTGFSKNELVNYDDYNTPVFSTVNSAILYPNYNGLDAYSMYTTSSAHKNGWMFEIPLTTRKTSGYLYNDSITSHEEALAHFCSIIGLDEKNKHKLKKFSWTPKYRKLAIDGNILYCGNKLFFFEPSQGFPLHYYAVICDIFISELKNKKELNTKLNSFYLDSIEKIQDVVALTYLSKNNFNTKFWNYVKPMAEKKLLSSEKFLEWCNNIENYTHYSSHSNEILLNIIDGMNIDLSTFKKKTWNI